MRIRDDLVYFIIADYIATFKKKFEVILLYN